MMPPIDFDELLPEIAIYAPKVPDIVAFRFIREAAREMCTRGKLWVVNDQFDITAPEYEGLTTIPDAEIVEIERAHFDDVPLEPKTRAWLDEKFDDWQSLEESPAKYVTQLELNSVTVVPKATGSLRLRLHLRPSRTATTLPSSLVEHYSTEIGIGAVGKALLVPRQDYTNPQLGLPKQAEFQKFLDTLSSTASQGQQKAPQRTRARFF
jgi:hypothetical protein